MTTLDYLFYWVGLIVCSVGIVAIALFVVAFIIVMLLEWRNGRDRDGIL